MKNLRPEVGCLLVELHLVINSFTHEGSNLAPTRVRAFSMFGSLLCKCVQYFSTGFVSARVAKEKLGFLIRSDDERDRETKGIDISNQEANDCSEL